MGELHFALGIQLHHQPLLLKALKNTLQNIGLILRQVKIII